MDCIRQHRGSTWSGWSEIARRARTWAECVDAEDGIEGNVFLFGVDYKDSAQLMYGLHRLDDSGECRWSVLAQNVVGCSALQFDYWKDPRLLGGQDAILVITRPDMRRDEISRVRPCFSTVDLLEHVRIRRLGRTVLEADILRCTRYVGPPKRTEPDDRPTMAEH